MNEGNDEGIPNPTTNPNSVGRLDSSSIDGFSSNSAGDDKQSFPAIQPEAGEEEEVGVGVGEKEKETGESSRWG